MDQPEIAIIPEYSSPYSQYQNSVEREVQTVCKGVSTLLHSQTFLVNSDWDIALSHYIDCRNNIPNIHHPTMSPYQQCTGRSSDMSKKFLYPFGDLVAVRIPPQLRSGGCCVYIYFSSLVFTSRCGSVASKSSSTSLAYPQISCHESA
jgi:hypothetical protein